MNCALPMKITWLATDVGGRFHFNWYTDSYAIDQEGVKITLLVIVLKTHKLTSPGVPSLQAISYSAIMISNFISSKDKAEFCTTLHSLNRCIS